MTLCVGVGGECMDRLPIRLIMLSARLADDYLCGVCISTLSGEWFYTALRSVCLSRNLPKQELTGTIPELSTLLTSLSVPCAGG